MTTDLFSPFDPIDGMPVTIVFGTFNYRDTIREWMNHAQSNCPHYRIVCADQELVHWLHENGQGDRAVYWDDLFPDDPAGDLRILHIKRHSRITLMRIRLWQALTASGRDFINSDADAFWLRNPIPYLLQHTQYDILASQGIDFPDKFYCRYRFVLCTGFFFCRANVRTANYFRRVEKLKTNHSDQIPLNLALLNDTKVRWHIRSPNIWLNKNTNKFKAHTWRKLPTPVSKIIMRLRELVPWLRTFEKNLPKHIIWICTSPEIISGKFSDDLNISIIPMYLVYRHNPGFNEIASSQPPMVAHLGSNKIGRWTTV